jgi:copper homeostasis protein
MQYELCVASPEAARIAEKAGVDRIETCTALGLGGLTPTLGMVGWIQSTFDLEQHVLIRQRAGGFEYSYDEIVVMRDDILRFRDLGVKGFVIGALKDGKPDTGVLETWARAAGSADLTFHRAFDDIADWKAALDRLVTLGFRRILTSGQSASVSEGLERLREMVSYASGRIEIMAGGGVRPENRDSVIATGVDAIHFSGTRSEKFDPESLFAADLSVPDEELIKLLAKKNL